MSRYKILSMLNICKFVFSWCKDEQPVPTSLLPASSRCVCFDLHSKTRNTSTSPCFNGQRFKDVHLLLFFVQHNTKRMNSSGGRFLVLFLASKKFNQSHWNRCWTWGLSKSSRWTVCSFENRCFDIIIFNHRLYGPPFYIYISTIYKISLRFGLPINLTSYKK